ncbi:hypothetical protein LTR10_001181 [Elasticomyces elasticus]|nr:hypothetical protein LTR10_001181 [Elasticomyces elasticus]KAK4965453.1 hypothetical protein LTR42_012209 [Elasticomyces elasticus]
MEQEKPPLLDLAAELRNKIYDLVVPSPNGYIVLGMTSGNETDDNTAVSPPPPRGALALSQTCQQLRRETLPMLFSCNTILFRTEYYLNDGEVVTGSKHNDIGTHTKNTTEVKVMLEGLRNWLDSVQEDSTRHMRDVCIWLGTVNMRSEDPGAVDKSLEFLYDTWTELQQHLYDIADLFDIPLDDRSKARRENHRELIVKRANLLKAQDKHLVKMGLAPRGTLFPEFEQDMLQQDSVVQILYD